MEDTDISSKTGQVQNMYLPVFYTCLVAKNVARREFLPFVKRFWLSASDVIDLEIQKHKIMSQKKKQITIVLPDCMEDTLKGQIIALLFGKLRAVLKTMDFPVNWHEKLLRQAE